MLEAQTGEITTLINGGFATLNEALNGKTGIINGTISTLEAKLSGSDSKMNVQIEKMDQQISSFKETNSTLVTKTTESQSQLEVAEKTLIEASNLLDATREKIETDTLETDMLRDEIRKTIQAARVAFDIKNNETKALMLQISDAVSAAEIRDIEREDAVALRETKAREHFQSYCRERAFANNYPIRELSGAASLTIKAKETLDVLMLMDPGTLSLSSACEKKWVVVQFPGSIQEERLGTIKDFAAAVDAEVLMERPIRAGLFGFK